MPLAGLPSATEGDIPDAVRSLAAGHPIIPVWRNELGGLTFRIELRTPVYVKWTPAGSIDLIIEQHRLIWAAQFIRVPRVIEYGHDETGSWLVTESLEAENAVSPRWAAEPERAAAAVGSALRRLHDSLPVAACPFSWNAEDRLAAIHRSRPNLDPQRWHPEHRHLTSAQALEILDDIPTVDKLVVCHGDSCAPNTLIDETGTGSAHVDFGKLGAADRWADLAIATWSTQWNYGPGFERILLDAYGIEPDPERTSYYRLLWDAAPD